VNLTDGFWHYIDRPESPNSVSGQKGSVLICLWGCLGGQHNATGPIIRFSISNIIPNTAFSKTNEQCAG